MPNDEPQSALGGAFLILGGLLVWVTYSWAQDAWQPHGGDFWRPYGAVMMVVNGALLLWLPRTGARFVFGTCIVTALVSAYWMMQHFRPRNTFAIFGTSGDFLANHTGGVLVAATFVPAGLAFVTYRLLLQDGDSENAFRDTGIFLALVTTLAVVWIATPLRFGLPCALGNRQQCGRAGKSSTPYTWHDSVGKTQREDCLKGSWRPAGTGRSSSGSRGTTTRSSTSRGSRTGPSTRASGSTSTRRPPRTAWSRA
jgi:hypothetical protein